ncbi:hypothetical protein HKD37_08G021102 [Glycine soja]
MECPKATGLNDMNKHKPQKPSSAKFHNSSPDRKEGMQLLGPFHFPTNKVFVRVLSLAKLPSAYLSFYNVSNSISFIL